MIFPNDNPPPQPNPISRNGYTLDPIIERVREKFLSRSQAGLKKYGVGLDRKDLSRLDWLNHHQQELMDAAAYVERQIVDEQKRIENLQVLKHTLFIIFSFLTFIGIAVAVVILFS